MQVHGIMVLHELATVPKGCPGVLYLHTVQGVRHIGVHFGDPGYRHTDEFVYAFVFLVPKHIATLS